MLLTPRHALAKKMALRSPIILPSPPRFQPASISGSSSPSELPPLESLIKKHSFLPASTDLTVTVTSCDARPRFKSPCLYLPSQKDDVEKVQYEENPRKKQRRATQRDGTERQASAEPMQNEDVTKVSVQQAKGGRLGRFRFEQGEAIAEDDMQTKSKGEKYVRDSSSKKEPKTIWSGSPRQTCNLDTRQEDVDISTKENEHATALRIASTTEVGEEMRSDGLSRSDAPQTVGITSITNKPKSSSRTRKPRKPTLKSARTVTSVAIAQYQPLARDDDTSQDMSPWDRVRISGSMSDRARMTLDPTSASRSKKKERAKPGRIKLLDPDAASARLDRQYIFFGTSSQLVRDEPLEQVRDLQQAMKESESVCDRIETLQGNNVDEQLPIRKGLWHIGSRGESGDTLKAEETVSKGRNNHDIKQKHSPVNIDDSENDHFKPRTVLKSAPRNTKSATLQCLRGTDGASADSTSALCSIPVNIVSPTGSVSQQRTYATSAKDTGMKNSSKQPVGRPRKDSITGSTSRKEEDKTAKSRKRSKVTIMREDPKWVCIDDIEDSEDAGEIIGNSDASKKSRNKPKLARKDEREEFMNDRAPALFPAITKAIKGEQKDKNDARKLTWQEKMLLYDPIVLEDLTMWLDGGRLEEGDVGNSDGKKRQRLEAWMVQLWCEEHSICCLWKEGLRGGVKTQY